MPHIEFSLELEHDSCLSSEWQQPNQRLQCQPCQDDDPEVKEVPPPPPPDVEYGSENEGQLPWEDKMVKAMQRDISAVLQ